MRIFLFLILSSQLASSQLFAMGNSTTNVDLGQDSSFNVLTTMGIALPVFGLGYFGLKHCYQKFRESFSNDELWLIGRENRVKIEKKSFGQWADLCKSLPRCSQVWTGPDKYKKTVLSKEEFIYSIADLLAAIGKSSIAYNKNWVAGNSCFYEKDFKVGVSGKDNYAHVVPGKKFFIQKLDLPKGSKVKIHADVHGDIHSLMAFLGDLIGDDFEIKDKNLYICFLGDYTDRGVFGAEVVYTIARLKTANPERIILLKGNHESIGLNRRYGFISDIYEETGPFVPGELASKFGLSDGYASYLLTKFYNTLASVVFIGCCAQENALELEKIDSSNCVGVIKRDYAILCHGGIEKSLDFDQLFIQKGSCLYQSVDQKNQNGCLWNDFTAQALDVSDLTIVGRKKYSLEETKNYFEDINKKENFKIKLKFGGHQHAEEMLDKLLNNGGLYNVWAGAEKQWKNFSRDFSETKLKIDPNYLVWILCSSLDNDGISNSKEKQIFDTHVTLNIGSSNSEDWSIEPKRIKVFKD